MDRVKQRENGNLVCEMGMGEQLDRLVVLEESPCPRGSSRTSWQLFVLVLETSDPCPCPCPRILSPCPCPRP